MGLLTGVRVVDFSRILSGPYLTMSLGDLGADVVKIEQPVLGDDTRHWGPPFYGQDSTYYLAINRNKRSIAIDLRAPAGRDLALRLVRCADIVVENFRRGGMERLGLGYEALRAVKPDLVMLRISAFGETGPDRDLPGYDLLAQAMGGIMGLTGHPGEAPVKAGVAVADLAAALFGLSAVLAALIHRDRTGEGQYITTSLFETQLALHINWAQNYFANGREPKPLGSAHPNLAPYQAFAATDGYFVLAVGNDALFRKCAQALGRSELAGEQRFASNAARVENREALAAILGEIFATGSRERWCAAMHRAGVPAGPIQSIAQIYASAQVEALGQVQTVSHPVAGDLPQVGFPAQLSGRQPEIRRHPPLRGEHTREIARGPVWTIARSIA
ncbi:MAG: CoA transferase [bacterium]|nr:CoA transferase [bacterium]